MGVCAEKRRAAAQRTPHDSSMAHWSLDLKKKLARTVKTPCMGQFFHNQSDSGKAGQNWVALPTNVWCDGTITSNYDWTKQNMVYRVNDAKAWVDDLQMNCINQPTEGWATLTGPTAPRPTPEGSTEAIIVLTGGNGDGCNFRDDTGPNLVIGPTNPLERDHGSYPKDNTYSCVYGPGVAPPPVDTGCVVTHEASCSSPDPNDNGVRVGCSLINGLCPRHGQGELCNTPNTGDCTTMMKQCLRMEEGFAPGTCYDLNYNISGPHGNPPCCVPYGKACEIPPIGGSGPSYFCGSCKKGHCDD